MTTITERFYELHPTSRKLFEERSKGLFPDGVTHETRFLSPFPIYATRAEGPRKWDVDGNEYIDYVSGHGSLLLGALASRRGQRGDRAGVQRDTPGRQHGA